MFKKTVIKQKAIKKRRELQSKIVVLTLPRLGVTRLALQSEPAIYMVYIDALDVGHFCYFNNSKVR